MNEARNATTSRLIHRLITSGDNFNKPVFEITMNVNGCVPRQAGLRLLLWRVVTRSPPLDSAHPSLWIDDLDLSERRIGGVGDGIFCVGCSALRP